MASEADVGLNGSFIDEMIHRMSIKHYNQGEYIIRKGEIGAEMFFITRGTVQIHIPNKDIHLSEGQFFGEVALFLDQVRMASVTAHTEVDVLLLKKKVLDKVLEKYPEIKDQFAEMGRQRLAMNAGGTTGTKETAGAGWMKEIASMSVGYDPTVQVIIRIRPPLAGEKDKAACVTKMGHQGVLVLDSSSAPEEQTQGKKEFKFDYVYGPSSTTQEVFDGVGLHICNSVYDMFNTCIFTYGQVATGKTHTVAGMVNLICADLFHRIASEIKLEGQETLFEWKVSFLEIYCERLRDLFVDARGTPATLTVRGTPETGIYVEGITKKAVSNFEEIMTLWATGENRRVKPPGGGADSSSPGHAIFTVYLRKIIRHAEGEQTTDCKLNIVDLAGTQREDNVSSQDSKSINTSLLSLSLVINKLAFESKNIPYRQSKLTMILAENFGGNSKTFMIATVGPVDVRMGLRTLRHAEFAMNIVNKPVKAAPKGAILKTSLMGGMANMFKFNQAARDNAPKPPTVDAMLKLIEEANSLCSKTGNAISFSIQPTSDLAGATYGVRLTDFSSTRTYLWDPLSFVKKLQEEKDWVQANFDDTTLTIRDGVDVTTEPFVIPMVDVLIGTVSVPFSAMRDMQKVEGVFPVETSFGKCNVNLAIVPEGKGSLDEYLDKEVPFTITVKNVSELVSRYNCGVFTRYNFPIDEVDEYLNVSARGPKTPSTTVALNHEGNYKQLITSSLLDSLSNEQAPCVIDLEIWAHESPELTEPAKLVALLEAANGRVAELEAENERMRTRCDKAVAGYNNLKEAYNALKAEQEKEREDILAKARSKLERHKTQLELVASENKTAKVASTLQKAVAESLRLERDKALTTTESMQARLSELEEALTSSEGRAKGLEEELATATGRIRELEDSGGQLLNLLEQAKRSGKEREDVLTKEMDGLSEKVAALTAECAALQEQLNKAQSDARHEVAALQKELGDLRGESSSLESKLRQVTSDLELSRKDVATLEAERDAKSAAFSELIRMYATLTRLSTHRNASVATAAGGATSPAAAASAGVGGGGT